MTHEACWLMRRGVIHAMATHIYHVMLLMGQEVEVIVAVSKDGRSTRPGQRETDERAIIH